MSNFEGDWKSRNDRIRKLKCAEIARFILNQDPIILDTETTGFGIHDEIISATAIDQYENIVFNIEVRPHTVKKIDPKVSAIHGYTDEIVKSFSEIDNWAKVINRCLDGKWIVAYNATYDIRMLYQSLGQFEEDPDIRFGAPYKGIFDLMQLYSEFNGSPGNQGAYKWHKLGIALNLEGIEYDLSSLHGALADATLTLKLLKFIAMWEE